MHYAKLPLFGHFKGYFIVVSARKIIGEVSLDRNFNELLHYFSYKKPQVFYSRFVTICSTCLLNMNEGERFG